MDVLGEILDVTGLRGRVFCRTEASAPWGLSLSPSSRVALHVVTRGACWLQLDGADSPCQLVQGDVVLIPGGRGHQLVDQPSSPTLPLTEWRKRKDERHRLISEHHGGGAVTHLICGAYEFASGEEHPLLGLLPPVIQARSSHLGAHAGLSRALTSLAVEFEQPGVGSSTIVSRLLDVIFIEILRSWLTELPEGDAGWLGALRDPAIARALERIHDQPAQDWSVAGLAREVGMSRAVFARRFSELVGLPPAGYLTRVRMDLAARLLRDSDHSLAEIAARVGYGSEHAFNRAFKKDRGMPPGAYRDARAAA